MNGEKIKYKNWFIQKEIIDFIVSFCRNAWKFHEKTKNIFLIWNIREFDYNSSKQTSTITNCIQMNVDKIPLYQFWEVNNHDAFINKEVTK